MIPDRGLNMYCFFYILKKPVPRKVWHHYRHKAVSGPCRYQTCSHALLLKRTLPSRCSQSYESATPVSIMALITARDLQQLISIIIYTTLPNVRNGVYCCSGYVRSHQEMGVWGRPPSPTTRGHHALFSTVRPAILTPICPGLSGG